MGIRGICYGDRNKVLKFNEQSKEIWGSNFRGTGDSSAQGPRQGLCCLFEESGREKAWLTIESEGENGRA